MTDVLVLHAALPAGDVADGAASLLSRLPYARRLELERRDARGRLASLAGIELARAGAARLRGRAVDLACLRFPSGGKPRLEGGPWFSVTHSAARVAVAVSDRCEVGLDLEEGASHRTALERWTATEAALKAVGAGLRSARDLRLAPDLQTADWAGTAIHLRALALADDAVACLATLAEVSSVVVERASIPW